MSMTIDISALASRTKRMAELKATGTDAIMRIVAVTMGGEVRERIHERGENSQGNQIGTYSTGYIKTREKNDRGASTKVILSLTRQMENDFVAVGQDPIKVDGGYALGFNNPINDIKATVAESGQSAHTVKAHKRMVNGKEVSVKSYQSSGRKGYGSIYKLTETENKQVKDIVEFEVNRFLTQ